MLWVAAETFRYLYVSNKTYYGLGGDQQSGPPFNCLIWAVLSEKVPNGLSHCHTKRRLKKKRRADDSGH